MSLGQRSFVLAYGLCALLFVVGCEHKVHPEAVAVVDNLSTNAGNCVQMVNGKIPANNKVVVDHSGGTVKWVAPNEQTSCTIHFDNSAATCPFYVAGQNYCDYSCTNGTVTSQPATGPAGSTFTYGSMMINGACTVGTNGIILDH